MLRPMSIWGKLAGAAAGLAVGGPIGALLGGFAGHFVIDRDKEGGDGATGQNQVAFTVGNGLVNGTHGASPHTVSSKS